jgi:hypothetical protein
MATCPDGHDSVSEDYCDVCGMLMTGGPAATGATSTGVPSAGTAVSVSSAMPPPSSASSAAGACPACGAPKTPGAFCEACGYNFASGALPSSVTSSYASSLTSAEPLPSVATSVPPVPGPIQGPRPTASASTWTAAVAADRVYYDRVKADSGDEAAGIEFPTYVPERRFPLAGPEMRIGRRSPSRGLDPEIDLTGPPTDPGISRLHAVLIATPDGGWAVLDPGSANGTQVNGTDIPTGEQIPLHDGDRIAMGAWTTITVSSGG